MMHGGSCGLNNKYSREQAKKQTTVQVIQKSFQSDSQELVHNM